MESRNERTGNATEVKEGAQGFKEAHGKADDTSVKTLAIPSCVLRALSPFLSSLYPSLPLLCVKIKASGIKGRAVHL